MCGNKPDAPDHAGCENPVVLLPALALHAVDARVDHLDRLFLGTQIDIHKTRHKYFLRLENKDLGR
jgi:hypothetical protein